MEGKVSVEVRMSDRVVLAWRIVSRVDGLHTCVKAEDEEVEIETKSNAVADGDLLVELVEAEFPFGLVGILSDGPDVTRIDKDGTIDFPEEEGTVFRTEVELDVSALVEEVDLSVGTLVGTRT